MNAKTTATAASLALLMACSIQAAPLPREMCFESYGLENYYSDRLPPIMLTDAEARANPYGYQRFMVTITKQVKDSAGYLNFQFIGHGNNLAGDEASIIGSGYRVGQRTHFSYKGNLLQLIDGNQAAYELNGLWDFAQGLNEGKSVRFNDVVSGVDHRFNDLDRGPVRRIPCSTFQPPRRDE